MSGCWSTGLAQSGSLLFYTAVRAGLPALFVACVCLDVVIPILCDNVAHRLHPVCLCVFWCNQKAVAVVRVFIQCVNSSETIGEKPSGVFCARPARWRCASSIVATSAPEPPLVQILAFLETALAFI